MLSNNVDKMASDYNDKTDPFQSNYQPKIPQYGTNNYQSPKGPFSSDNSSTSPSIRSLENKRKNNINLTGSSIQNTAKVSDNQSGPFSAVDSETLAVFCMLLPVTFILFFLLFSSPLMEGDVDVLSEENGPLGD